MQRKPLRAGVALLALTAAASVAPGTTAPAQEIAPRPSLNLYGVTGLIDMPSAEAQPDAQMSASYSQFGDTARRNFTFQLLPRISATVRYSTIYNWGRTDDPVKRMRAGSFASASTKAFAFSTPLTATASTRPICIMASGSSGRPWTAGRERATRSGF